MTAVLNQMGVLLGVMIVGVVCFKLKITGPAFNKAASPVTMNVLLTCTILGAMLNNEISLGTGSIVFQILIYFVSVGICMVIGILVSRMLRLKGIERGNAEFMLTLSNAAFVAFPVIVSVYGADGLFYASLSNVAFNVVAFTIGIAMVSGDIKDMKIKQIINAPVVATIIAVILFVFGIRVPDFLKYFFESVGKATVPVSMLMVGTSLGAVSLKDTIGDWRVYILSFFRLIICPLVVWVFIRLVTSDPMLIGAAVIIASAPAPMIMTVFAVQFGKEESFSAKCIFVSTVLSVVTMPLMIWLLLR